MSEKRARLGVLISGSGTNLQAIIDASRDGSLDADVAVVISNHEEAYGLERARKDHIPAAWIDRTAYTQFSDYNHVIRTTLEEHECDWVVMAGYMRLLGKEVLEAFPGRVVNIHPALLPSFAGPAGIRDAFEYGVKVTGVTIHFADDKFDEGPVIAQEAVIIAEDDTVESLESKIHAVEHDLYPRTLQLLVHGLVRLEGRRVHVAKI